MSRQITNANVESMRQPTLVSTKPTQNSIVSLSLQASQQRSAGYKFGSTSVSKQTSFFDNEGEKVYYKKSNQNTSKNQDTVEAPRIMPDEEDKESTRHLNINEDLVDDFSKPKSQVSKGLKYLKSMSVGEQGCRKQLMQHHLSVIEAMELLDLDVDSEFVKQAMDQLFQQNVVQPPNEIEVWMSEYSYEDFLTIHEPQLLTSAVPDHFWQSLYEKLKNSQLDSGDSFQIIVEQDEEGDNQSYSVVALNDLSVNDPKNIYLIDHSWTFRLNSAREALNEVLGLKERLMEAFGIKAEDLLDVDEAGSDYIGSETGDAKPKTPRTSESHGDDHDSDHSTAASSISEIDGKIINAILEKLPEYMQTYTMKTRKNVIDNNDMALWFLVDEFGLRIGHSVDPNFRMIPFYYAFDQIAYSILFPLKNVAAEEEVTRNYVEGLLMHTHPNWYNILRLPWEQIDLTSEPITFSHKDDSYFMDGRLPDQIDNLKLGSASDANGMLDTIKIYATDDQLLKNLRAVSFELTDNIYEADVIWSRDHFHDFTSLAERNPNALVNQFPFESSLTVKDLFATCVQSCPEFEKSFDDEKLEWKWPGFYPVTFNLNEELPAFVTYFQKRQQRNLENSWIVKPWNLARGLDTFITKNLNYVVRLAETGPKLVQKYIENPVLFRRPDTGKLVKFDLRYIVFVRSLDPLEIYLYKDFWPRCAINDYDLLDLDDLLSHLSVFNYSDKEKVLNIRSNEFIDCLQKLHPQIEWPKVQEKIDHVIREVLKIAAHNKAPRGMVPNAQSRGMYGFDLMMQWQDGEQKDVDVMFLEANFIPDCQRACEFYPDFADTVFQTLFLGGGSERTRQIS